MREQNGTIDNAEAPSTSPVNHELSTHYVRLIQVVFGFVIANSLTASRGVLLEPWRYPVAFIALGSVYLTVTSSWLAWHQDMTARPYLVADKPQGREVFRVLVDLSIVAAYARLLFTVEPLAQDPSASLTQYVATFALIFGLYGLWVRLLGKAYPDAPKSVARNWWFATLFAVMAVAYFVSFRATSDLPDRPDVLNGLTAALAAASVLVYRVHNHRAGHGISGQIASA